MPNAITTIQGPGGSITLAQSTGVKLGTWSATLLFPTVRTTGFADNGNRTSEIVAVELSGSAVGVVVANTAIVPSTALGTNPTLSGMQGTVTLYGAASSGGNYTFLANVNAVPLSRVCNGEYGGAFNFENTGPITQS